MLAGIVVGSSPSITGSVSDHARSSPSDPVMMCATLPACWARRREGSVPKIGFRHIQQTGAAHPLDCAAAGAAGIDKLKAGRRQLLSWQVRPHPMAPTGGISRASMALSTYAHW